MQNKIFVLFFLLLFLLVLFIISKSNSEIVRERRKPHKENNDLLRYVSSCAVSFLSLGGDSPVKV